MHIERILDALRLNHTSYAYSARGRSARASPLRRVVKFQSSMTRQYSAQMESLGDIPLRFSRSEISPGNSSA
jgi:hypothetical protein